MSWPTGDQTAFINALRDCLGLEPLPHTPGALEIEQPTQRLLWDGCRQVSRKPTCDCSYAGRNQRGAA
jgi:hypothetical protein